jgi:hypothetical protein
MVTNALSSVGTLGKFAVETAAFENANASLTQWAHGIITTTSGSPTMPELAGIRGSHHCIGTGRAVADVIFGLVHSQATKNGGVLSAEEILSLKAQFVLSLPAGIAFFEKVNQQCMRIVGFCSNISSTNCRASFVLPIRAAAAAETQMAEPQRC